MVTVTSLTADRMLAIEDSCIVDAEIQGDDLILITYGGDSINVGNVRGPMGAISDSGWIDLTINSGYVPQNTAQRPQIRKIGNMVYGRGGLNNSGITASTAHGNVMTIPDGYRPLNGTPGGAQVFSAGTSGGNATAQWFVNPTGFIDIRTNSTLSSYYFFSGATWSID